MHGNPDFANAVRQVTHDALSVTSQTRNLRYDLLGGVFHRVLDTARYDGSYYTTAAAATLLAGLAIPDDWVDWSDAEAITDLRVCDPACGSGTLLLAALERIERLGTAAAANGANNGASAVNGAATVHLGSIDLLPGADVQFETMREYGSHSQVEVDAEDVRAGNPPKMNLVIMNPPFTRDSWRHDQLGPGGEAAMKAASPVSGLALSHRHHRHPARPKPHRAVGQHQHLRDAGDRSTSSAWRVAERRPADQVGVAAAEPGEHAGSARDACRHQTNAIWRTR